MSGRDGQDLLEDEGAGYLISVSDLMSGLLFIFIITLMAFVLNFHRETRKAAVEKARAESTRVQLGNEKAKAQSRQRILNAEIDRTQIENGRLARERDRLKEQIRKKARVLDNLTNAKRLRSEMLEQIRDALMRVGIHVEIDTEHGILHLTGQAVHFPMSKAILPPEEETKLNKIGQVLAEVVPCYVASPPPPASCSKAHPGKLDSVLVEGHTDNMPYKNGPYHDNLNLSAQRALYTYDRMVLQRYPLLAELRNSDAFPVFSVSGYGASRPRHRYLGPTPDPANRRIDLRFIMTPPHEDLAPVKELRGEGL